MTYDAYRQWQSFYQRIDATVELTNETAEVADRRNDDHQIWIQKVTISVIDGVGEVSVHSEDDTVTVAVIDPAVDGRHANLDFGPTGVPLPLGVPLYATVAADTTAVIHVEGYQKMPFPTAYKANMDVVPYVAPEP